MRNLQEYPITKAEVVETLTSLAEEISKEGNMGDTRPLILLTAAAVIDRRGIDIQ